VNNCFRLNLTENPLQAIIVSQVKFDGLSAINIYWIRINRSMKVIFFFDNIAYIPAKKSACACNKEFFDCTLPSSSPLPSREGTEGRVKNNFGHPHPYPPPSRGRE